MVPKIPPPPLRQDLSSQKLNYLENNLDNLQTYSTNMVVLNDFNNINKRLSNVSSKSADSSTATFDANFQNLTPIEIYNKNFNHFKDDQNDYDQTCDNTFLLKISQSGSSENFENKKTSLLSPNNMDTKLNHSGSNNSGSNCQNERESGYGSGSKNKYFLSQSSPLQTQQVISSPSHFTTFAQR